MRFAAGLGPLRIVHSTAAPTPTGLNQARLKFLRNVDLVTPVSASKKGTIKKRKPGL